MAQGEARHDMEAEDITDIEGVRIWAIQHDADSKPRWNKQETTNGQVNAMAEEQKKRLETLERKMAKYGGAAFVVGTILATALGWFLNHVGSR